MTRALSREPPLMWSPSRPSVDHGSSAAAPCWAAWSVPDAETPLHRPPRRATAVRRSPPSRSDIRRPRQARAAPRWYIDDTVHMEWNRSLAHVRSASPCGPTSTHQPRARPTALDAGRFARVGCRRLTAAVCGSNRPVDRWLARTRSTSCRAVRPDSTPGTSSGDPLRRAGCTRNNSPSRRRICACPSRLACRSTSANRCRASE